MNKEKKWLLILLLLTSFTVRSNQTAQKLTINIRHQHQSIDGFGASDAWIIDPLIRHWMQNGHEQAIESLADTLFSIDKGIGLSAWRFNIGAGSAEQGDASQIHPAKYFRRAELMQAEPFGNINLNKQVGQIRLLAEAAERNVADLVAFANSPPVWATKNGLARADKTVGSSNLQPDKLNAFADFLVNVVQYLRDERNIPINYLSPINEPTWHWADAKQEGNRYNNSEMAAVYRAVYAQLNKYKLSKKVYIEAGEVVEYKAALSDPYFALYSGKEGVYDAGMNTEGSGQYRNYIDLLLGDVEMRKIVNNKISIHGYFSDAWLNDMGRLRDLVWQNLQQTSPGAKVWMSEMCVLGDSGDVRTFEGPGWAEDDMQYALHIGKMLHRDLTRLNASAWHWWLAVTAYSYKDGLIQVSANFEPNTLKTSKALWVLGQYSKFIRPGFIRIDLVGADNLSGLMASAYKGDDEQSIVIVLVNASSSPTQIDLDIKGLSPHTSVTNMKLYQTNQTNNLAYKGDMILPPSQHIVYPVPAESVVTLVGALNSLNTSISPLNFNHED